MLILRILIRVACIMLGYNLQVILLIWKSVLSSRSYHSIWGTEIITCTEMRWLTHYFCIFFMVERCLNVIVICVCNLYCICWTCMQWMELHNIYSWALVMSPPKYKYVNQGNPLSKISIYTCYSSRAPRVSEKISRNSSGLILGTYCWSDFVQ